MAVESVEIVGPLPYRSSRSAATRWRSCSPVTRDEDSVDSLCSGSPGITDVRAHPILTDVAKVAEEAGKGGVRKHRSSADRRHSDLGDARRARQRARRVEALSLKLAGVSTAQTAERMGIRPDTVRHLVNRTLRTAENRAVEEMRELENARLDRAQAAIWSQVLAGTAEPWWSSCRSASAGPN